MRIEPITLSDIPELVEMTRQAHAESKYSYLPFSEQSVIESFTSHINGGLAVKVMTDKIAGFFAGAASAMVFSATPISVETSYYVRPEYRGTRCFYLLIKAFMDWSGDKPQFMMPHFAHDNSKTYSALEKLGFVEAGRIYVRRKNNGLH